MVVAVVGAEHDGRVDLAPLHRKNPRSRPDHGAEFFAKSAQRHRIETIGPADQNQIGRLQLIVEQAIDVIKVIEAGVRRSLGFDGLEISHHGSTRQRFTIHHGHHAVDAGAGANFRPLEGLHKGQGQGQPTGFDNDAIEVAGLLEQGRHRWQEIFLHGAAKTAIRQFDQAAIQLPIRAEATVPQQRPINPHFTEFIHQHGQSKTGVQEQMTEQGCLTSPQKTGDHRHRDTGRCRSVGHGKEGWRESGWSGRVRQRMPLGWSALNPQGVSSGSAGCRGC